MAKKEKDAAASAKEAKVKESKKKEPKVKETKKKEPKVKAPPDPVKTRNFIRLLNLLALILAIVAFLLQLFAVLSHHWKWQTTDLRSVVSPTVQPPPSSFRSDALLDQHYGLLSRQINLLAKNDEQLNVMGSTRFPRIDDGDDNFHHCLSETTTLRGAFLTCSSHITAPDECHCRRYPYWNVVIVFEILALILLGLVVVLAALLATHLQDLLKFAAAGLALLAFLLLLLGLILILTHLKRETRSLADAYPHIYQRIVSNLPSPPSSSGNSPQIAQAVRLPGRVRRGDSYRVYPLSIGQFPYNETHFVEFSKADNSWVYKPFATTPINVPPPLVASKGSNNNLFATPLDTDTPAQSYGTYGPLLTYDRIFDTTRAGIGWSTVLSILAMILALLLALLLVLSALQAKSLAPKKPDTKISEGGTYELVSQEIPTEIKVPQPISIDLNPSKTVNEVVTTAQNISQLPNVDVVKKAVTTTLESTSIPLSLPEGTEVRNVVIPATETVANVVQENLLPTVADTIQQVQRS